MGTPRIALASCEELPGLDDDGKELLRALGEHDVDAAPVVWDAPDVDWASYDLVVVRGTWDYVPKLPAFLEWADHVASISRLLNPPAVIRWNTDKRYLAELERAGVPVVPTEFLTPGDEPDHGFTDVDWASYDLVVVRGTWDYVPKLPAFLEWADHVASVSRLLNPPAVIRWNTDKRYLAELERAGVPVVPTEFLAPGDEPDHGFVGVEHVVKPVVSAGSRDTLRLAPGDERSRSHASSLLAAGRGVMVQPYLHEVDDHGETALLFLDGQFSHAMRKGPLLAPGMELVEDLYAEEEMSVREPSAAEREVAEAVLAAIPHGLGDDLLYARVDLLPSPEGPRLLELELTEPSLFLDHHPPGADALAKAVVRRA